MQDAILVGEGFFTVFTFEFLVVEALHLRFLQFYSLKVQVALWTHLDLHGFHLALDAPGAVDRFTADFAAAHCWFVYYVAADCTGEEFRELLSHLHINCCKTHHLSFRLAIHRPLEHRMADERFFVCEVKHFLTDRF
jgi:hypothetical protein